MTALLSGVNHKPGASEPADSGNTCKLLFSCFRSIAIRSETTETVVAEQRRAGRREKRAQMRDVFFRKTGAHLQARPRFVCLQSAVRSLSAVRTRRKREPAPIRTNHRWTNWQVFVWSAKPTQERARVVAITSRDKRPRERHPTVVAKCAGSAAVMADEKPDVTATLRGQSEATMNGQPVRGALFAFMFALWVLAAFAALASILPIP